MLRIEYPVIMPDGSENNELIKHYSDNGFLLLQKETGIIYSEAIDIYPCPYTYEETDIPEVQEEELNN